MGEREKVENGKGEYMVIGGMREGVKNLDRIWGEMLASLQPEAEIAHQEVRLKMERDNLEKEKSVLMGTASNRDNQDGALEIAVDGEKYRCLGFAKVKK